MMSKLIKSAPFSPVVTGSLLYLLTRAPPSTRGPLLLRLNRSLSAPNIARLITTLKWLFAVGLIRNLNSFLTELANNNWALRAQKQDWVWSKEIAVVTGGSSGFGALFSKDLAAKGLHVVALDVNEPPEDIQRNPRITFIKCDVTNVDSVKEAASQIQSTIGHPSILINNAGIGKGVPILESSPEFLRKIFDVNIISHYYLLQAFLPDMIKKKKGHVVSIASVASFVSPPGLSHYAETKAAVLVLHEGLGAELRTISKCPEIKLTIVHPSWANTPMVSKYKDKLEAAGQRVMNPQRVSDAVVKQILSCRGAQLIIPPGESMLSTLRSWPTWLRYLMLRAGEEADTGLKAPDL